MSRLFKCGLVALAMASIVLFAGGQSFGDGQHFGANVATDSAADLRSGAAIISKWVQPPDVDTTGMDVNDSFFPGGFGWVLADDFLCTSTGPITQIRFWGSWYGDYYPFGDDPSAVTFTLSIHDDLPSPPEPYSKPGNLLWIHRYGPGECQVEFVPIPSYEGWFEPPDYYEEFGDTMCWMYICPGPDPVEFIQEGTDANPIIYWLDVQAEPLDLNAWFGWKTSIDHWNDDAVWAMGVDDGNPPPWEELRYPLSHPYAGASIDLAFELFGEEAPPVDQVICEPQPPNHPTEYWYEVTRSVDYYCDFHVVVDDPNPCNYTNWNAPAGWLFDVHKVGDKWWASWWDPTSGCTNAITGTFTFRFSNPNPSVWSDWTITQGNSRDPHLMVLDESGLHTTEADGYGYRVHVPSNPEPTAYKWFQNPDLNATGIDVYAANTNAYTGEQTVLADDFECRQRGEIREITVFGSWLDDYMPGGDPASAMFNLSIHADDPVGPGWSVPAELLWRRTFFPGDYIVEPCAQNLNEGFYFPPADDYIPAADTLCWKYTFFLQPGEFIQEGTEQEPVVYWLDVQYLSSLSPDPFATFGWKTSLEHWNDDAVWATGTDDGQPLFWWEMFYPPTHAFAGESMDLAFGIVSEPVEPADVVVCEPQPPTHPPDYWYTVTRSTDYYCDFHVRVQDPNPCDYSNWNAPAGWVHAVHKVGSEWWASWWDPTSGCANAITGTFTFRYSNPNPSAWDEWTITQGNSPDPHLMVLDEANLHTTDPDGYGYRVHVPSAPAEEYKWVQTPDVNPTGMDVYASQPTLSSLDFIVLADDFECTEPGYITEITVWGSWLGDEYPLSDPARAAFRLSLHSDDPLGPSGWSVPAELLWMREYLPGDYMVEPCATELNEGFYFPQSMIYEPGADTVCWKYIFPVPVGEFRQTGTPDQPVVYWLDVQQLTQFSNPFAVFGWKTSLDHWNDDAVWAFGEDAPGSLLDWFELRFPQGHPLQGESIDLAFAIKGTNCPLVVSPLPEPVVVPKNRFISMLPTNAGMNTALRVTLTDLPGDYDIWNGYQMWVTDPQPVTEQSGETGSTPPTFTAAYLTCQPDCRDWGALGLIDVYGNAVIPGATYEVQAVDCSCDLADEFSFSTPPLVATTSQYGDVCASFDSVNCWWPPPDGSVSIPFDTISIIEKFKNSACAPRKARADLIGVPPNLGCVDMTISVLDYLATVSAFQGAPFSIPPLGADPCNLPLPCPQP